MGEHTHTHPFGGNGVTLSLCSKVGLGVQCTRDCPSVVRGPGAVSVPAGGRPGGGGGGGIGAARGAASQGEPGPQRWRLHFAGAAATLPRPRAIEALVLPARTRGSSRQGVCLGRRRGKQVVKCKTPWHVFQETLLKDMKYLRDVLKLNQRKKERGKKAVFSKIHLLIPWVLCPWCTLTRSQPFEAGLDNCLLGLGRGRAKRGTETTAESPPLDAHRPQNRDTRGSRSGWRPLF